MNTPFADMPIRFFIYDEETQNDHDDTQGNYREATELEFLEAEGVVEYERFTVFDHGCKQVCLTKNPFGA